MYEARSFWFYLPIWPVSYTHLDVYKRQVEEFARRNPEELKQIYGLELPLLEEEGHKFLRRYFFEPAINIEGLSSGYQGQGVKTILPSEAKAKLEVRLVPGLEPQDVLDKIRKQLIKNGYPKVELIYTLGEMSYRSDMSAPSVLSRCV